ncbi:MAG TPA: hypothetical protein EYF93_01590 [Planctomycetes bacterium]|nr:hypothetical protein [Planctomycetota bacterium]
MTTGLLLVLLTRLRSRLLLRAPRRGTSTILSRAREALHLGDQFIDHRQGLLLNRLVLITGVFFFEQVLDLLHVAGDLIDQSADLSEWIGRVENIKRVNIKRINIKRINIKRVLLGHFIGGLRPSRLYDPIRLYDGLRLLR